MLLRILIVTTLMTVAGSRALAQQPVEPLLQKYCLGCHNDTDKEVGLSLQTMASLKAGSDNGPVIDSEMPAKSLLAAVLHKGADNAMPPDGEPQPTDAERQRLLQWVLDGAKIKSMAAGVPSVPAVKPFDNVVPALLASAHAPQHKAVAVAGARHVALLEQDSLEAKWRVPVENARVTQLSLATTQPWLVAASGMPGVNGKALLLSVDDGRVMKEFGGHTDAVYAAVINPSDRLIATAGYDRRILLHDVDSGKVLKNLDGHNGSVFSLCFDPSGKLLCSASADGTVKVWNVETGERLDTLSQPTAEQYAVLISRDGKQIFAAGADNRIRTWQLVSRDTPRINPLTASRFAHEQAIHRMSLSADGTLLASAAEDGTVRVWTTSLLEHHQILPRQKRPVTSLTFVNNSKLLITRLDGSLELLPVKPSTAAPSTSGDSATAEVASVMLAEKVNEIAEAENNNDVQNAQAVSLPATITGLIKPDGGNDRDVDCFRFSASAGQQLVLEVAAQQNKSPLDSKIEVLTADGKRIVRTQLQAVRDSYFTFRGKDSDTANDYRVFNWREMELNEYLYADGEVVKLWMYPRGPDSGYMVYPGFGKRFAYFGTTPTSHALQAPCFIVVPHAPDEKLTPNGLPVFPIYFENDDDSQRELGSDSRLLFTAPATADYTVRLTDARGFSGTDFSYSLTVRSPKPDFEVAVNTRKVSVAAGTGKEVVFTAKRIDGFDGPITIDITGLPAGFGFSGPIEIEAGQLQAFGTVYATDAAKEPTSEQLANIKIVAASEVHGEKDLGKWEELKLLTDPKLKVLVTRSGASDEQPPSAENPLVLTIQPGDTIQATVKLDRRKHDGIVSFGKEDSGRNLPHGVFVDNIGLNGLLLLSDQSEREFFITAAKVIQESTSTFYLKSNVDGITSLPVTLKVVASDGLAPGKQVTNR